MMTSVLMISTINLRIPRRVGVPAGELLHEIPELGGARLHLHGGGYVNHLDRLLTDPFCLLFAAHVVSTKQIHGCQYKLS